MLRNSIFHHGARQGHARSTLGSTLSVQTTFFPEVPGTQRMAASVDNFSFLAPPRRCAEGGGLERHGLEV